MPNLQSMAHRCDKRGEKMSILGMGASWRKGNVRVYARTNGIFLYMKARKVRNFIIN